MQNNDEDNLSKKIDDSSNANKSLENNEESLNQDDSTSGEDNVLITKFNIKESTNDEINSIIPNKKDVDNDISPKK